LLTLVNKNTDVHHLSSQCIK